jgi:hypothetical protein
MKFKKLFPFFILFVQFVFSQSNVKFDNYFIDKALRIDFYQVGDAKVEFITIDKIYQESIWPESMKNLIDNLNYGRYALKVYDAASNNLIYSKGFACMFDEYQTTTPALNGIKKTFNRSIHFPYPKKPVKIVFEARDKSNLLHSIYSENIDLNDVNIIKETNKANDYVYQSLNSGDPHNKVDLVFIAEGYTADERDKFKSDVDKYTNYLFEFEPYKHNKTKFNIYGIMRPSPESAMDEPRQGIFKKTILNSSFNAFGTDRYLLTDEGIKMREIASQVPYDAIVVLVNSKRYGGGGIFNDYCITTVDNQASKMVFVHEFGHSFAGLADEYYTSDVAYYDFYPKGIEPLEPNITALLDPKNVKWKDLLSSGIGIPTEYGKDLRDSLSADKRKNFGDLRKASEDAKKANKTDKEIKKIEEKFLDIDKNITKKIDAIKSKYADLVDKIGVFEGAGYASKGLYRPMIYCIMISNPKNEFCLVCQQVIQRMINYYAVE